MSNSQKREIKHKSIFLTYFYMFVTFGIYGVVWTVKSKRDMNALGAEIPSSFLLIVPIVNFYWMYKYAEGFSKHIEKDDSAVKWFAINLFLGFVTPYFVQSKLNELSNSSVKQPVKKKIESLAA